MRERERRGPENEAIETKSYSKQNDHVFLTWHIIINVKKQKISSQEAPDLIPLCLANTNWIGLGTVEKVGELLLVQYFEVWVFPNDNKIG